MAASTQQQATEAKLKHEKFPSEELRRAEAAQHQAEDLPNRQLDLRRNQEAAEQARKTAEDPRTAREANEILARNVSQPGIYRREAKADAKAERELAQESQGHVEEARAAAAKDAYDEPVVALVKRAGA